MFLSHSFFLSSLFYDLSFSHVYLILSPLPFCFSPIFISLDSFFSLISSFVFLSLSFSFISVNKNPSTKHEEQRIINPFSSNFHSIFWLKKQLKQSYLNTKQHQQTGENGFRLVGHKGFVVENPSGFKSGFGGIPY